MKTLRSTHNCTGQPWLRQVIQKAFMSLWESGLEGQKQVSVYMKGFSLPWCIIFPATVEPYRYPKVGRRP